MSAALITQMKRLELTEAELMHVLDEACLISSECIRVWHIAEPDATAAVRWLRSRRVRYGTAYGGTHANEKVLSTT